MAIINRSLTSLTLYTAERLVTVLTETLMANLPDRISYLEPVRKQLTAMAAEDINEDVDLSVLRRVVRKRIKGKSIEDSCVLLNEDVEKLEKWLSSANEKDQRLAFVLPILPEANEILFAKPNKGPTERGEVSMELPVDVKVKKEYGCLEAWLNKMFLSIMPQYQDGIERLTKEFHRNIERSAQVSGCAYSAVAVRYGNVVGTKFISKSSVPIFDKSVNYALEVPGGHVICTVLSVRVSHDFDESNLEAHFSTLRVLNCTPPAILQANAGK